MKKKKIREAAAPQLDNEMVVELVLVAFCSVDKNKYSVAASASDDNKIFISCDENGYGEPDDYDEDKAKEMQHAKKLNIKESNRSSKLKRLMLEDFDSPEEPPTDPWENDSAEILDILEKFGFHESQHAVTKHQIVVVEFTDTVWNNIQNKVVPPGLKVINKRALDELFGDMAAKQNELKLKNAIPEYGATGMQFGPAVVSPGQGYHHGHGTGQNLYEKKKK